MPNVSQPNANWMQQKEQELRGPQAKCAPAAPGSSKPGSLEQTLSPHTTGMTGFEDKHLIQLPKQPMTHTVTPCIGLEWGLDPVQEIENLREAKGSERIQGLMGFKEKLDMMSDAQLEQAQSHLTDALSSETNSDDALLGGLLKAVNQERNSRQGKIEPFRPRPPILKDFPGPISD